MGVPADLGRCGFSAVKKQPALQIFKVQAAFLGSQQIRPLSRGGGLGRGLLRAARISVLNGGGFCLLTRGERVGVRLPAEGCLHLNMMGVQAAFSVWRQSALRAATSSVGMAAQRHETMRIRKFIVLKKNEKAACTSFSTVQAAFLRPIRFMPPLSSLAANSCRHFRACAFRW